MDRVHNYVVDPCLSQPFMFQNDQFLSNHIKVLTSFCVATLLKKVTLSIKMLTSTMKKLTYAKFNLVHNI